MGRYNVKGRKGNKEWTSSQNNGIKPFKRNYRKNREEGKKGDKTRQNEIERAGEIKCIIPIKI